MFDLRLEPRSVVPGRADTSEVLVEVVNPRAYLFWQVCGQFHVAPMQNS